MKKKHHTRVLGRKAAGRKALWRGLMIALFEHGSIVTTETKAKELRLFCEPLITKARKGDGLANRRALLAALGHNKQGVENLLRIGAAHKERQGGYLRLTRLPKLRQDATRMARIDLVDGGVA